MVEDDAVAAPPAEQEAGGACGAVHICRGGGRKWERKFVGGKERKEAASCSTI
jgi:hypothetical protein